MEKTWLKSELVLNANGTVYHLNLINEQIADTVLLVGDPERVAMISNHFETIEHRIQHREFVTHTGTYHGKRITALSSGIGTDNIDIVLNELYAATAFDLGLRKPLKNKRQLDIVRIGTSGAIKPNIAIGQTIASSFGLGLDGLQGYYNLPFSEIEIELQKQLSEGTSWPVELAKPYLVGGDDYLMERLGRNAEHGITISATGFYGPQGRQLLPSTQRFNPFETLVSVDLDEHEITNFDMETAAIYGLGRMFGFRCLTLNTIIANRATGAFSQNPKKQVEDLIEQVLHSL